MVRAAEQEVIAAREDVSRAKARVACCQMSVAFSTEAVNVAQASISNATQAVNSAERSLEFAHAAERLVRVAQEKMLAEVESAENMMSETRVAQEFTDSAGTYLRTADQAEDAAQIYATYVRKELEHRIQLLYHLNRPTLEPGDWSLPRNVSPSEIKVYARSDGKTQVVYGDKRDKSGQITGPHGHTVISKKGGIEYARTQKGTVKKDLRVKPRKAKKSANQHKVGKNRSGGLGKSLASRKLAKYTDKLGRPIAIRVWKSGNHVYLRAYDTGKVTVPEIINQGQAGYANLTIERSNEGHIRVRLNDIMTRPNYRKSGIGDHILNMEIEYARKNRGTEIYGTIENKDAQIFWKRQSDSGWKIRKKGVYGEIHHLLK